MADGLLDVKSQAEQAAQALQKLAQAMAQGEGAAQKEEGALKKLGSAYSSLSSAATTVGHLASVLVESAVAADRHNRALAQLGAAYDAVKAATNDTVTAEQALHAQQALVQSGLRVSNTELAAITRKAREYAQATGTDTTQAIEQFVDALKNGEAGGLRRFGLTVQQNETRTHAFHRVLNQVTNEMSGMAPAARTLAEEQERMNRAFDDAKGGLATEIAKLINLNEVLSFVTNSLRRLRELLPEESRTSAASERGYHPNGVPAAVAAAVAGPTLSVADTSGGAGVGSDLPPPVVSSGGGGGRRTVDRGFISKEAMDKLRGRDVNTGGALFSRIAAERDAAIAALRIAATGKSPGDPDKLTPEQFTAAVQASKAAAAEVNQQRVQFESMLASGSIAQRMAREEKELQEALRGGVTTVGKLESEQRELFERTLTASPAEKQELDAKIQMLERVKNAHLDLVRAQQQSANYQEQFTEATKSALHLQQSTAQGAAETFGGLMQTMTGAFKAHMAAVIEGRETIAEAFKGLVKDILLSIATESAVQAIFETAKGIAKLAGSYGTDGTASGHFAAAALYASIAVGAGAGAYAMNQADRGNAATAGGSTPYAVPAQAGQAVPAGSNGPTNITVNVNGALSTKEEIANEIHKVNQDNARRGLS